MYTPEFEAAVRAWAQTQVDGNRWDHVCGVVEAADALARQYAPGEIARVRLAGWLHDAAKHWPPADLLAYAAERQLPITPTERDVPDLLHGAVGYAIAAEHFGLDDPALRSACALHTTGSPGMSVTDKIVFLADLIEPNRPAHRADPVRDAAARDLDEAVLVAVNDVIIYLVRKQRIVDPRAVALHNALVRAGVRHPLA